MPEVADWCAVDLLRADGELERVALAHADPEMLEKGARGEPALSPRAGRGTGPAHVVPQRPLRAIAAEVAPRAAPSRDRRRSTTWSSCSALGMRSAMTVPMTARGDTRRARSTFVTGPFRAPLRRSATSSSPRSWRGVARTAIDNARLYGERAYIARTLQESLLPSELPDIPGIETAARFRPTGEGNEMGGDFYDLFASGRRGWTVVIGDVCGKGPDAAAVTALARYTLRAAAMRERLPSRGLHVLNEALLRQRADRRFCTVAYAYLESTERRRARGLRQRRPPAAPAAAL